ncbi:VOC family protein [Massilia sp. CCM 8695]|uniref:VOC family protein n=1 Tax=Massilia frigida TaxID=2609281 RepID=A0ABX0NC08_9BURK|nr:VOC family protein [Massilia frigida]NHZ82997.1 VOC family protein [Massilia frigida]
MIIDHLGFAVSDYEQSKTFFGKALAPLGISVIIEVKGWAGLGKNGKPEFWFGQGGTVQGQMHVAFAADSREQVRQFYAAALEAGAKDNGAPGIRAHYHPDYYGAFVIGPDGHNIEAVCHQAEA